MHGTVDVKHIAITVRINSHIAVQTGGGFCITVLHLVELDSALVIIVNTVYGIQGMDPRRENGDAVPQSIPTQTSLAVQVYFRVRIVITKNSREDRGVTGKLRCSLLWH